MGEWMGGRRNGAVIDNVIQQLVQKRIRLFRGKESEFGHGEIIIEPQNAESRKG